MPGLSFASADAAQSFRVTVPQRRPRRRCSGVPEGYEVESETRSQSLRHRRHLPARIDRHGTFVCEPPAMMDAVETALVSLGVPGDSIDTERFHVV